MDAEDLEPMLLKQIRGIGYEDTSQVMVIILADGTEWYFHGVYDFGVEPCYPSLRLQ